MCFNNVGTSKAKGLIWDGGMLCGKLKKGGAWGFSSLINLFMGWIDPGKGEWWSLKVSLGSLPVLNIG